MSSGASSLSGVELEPTAFGGRYTLIRRLAVGGMAEIYLARQAAMAGFEKEIVIKRLRSELASDSRVIEMFLDEARIGALLNHPNIVHVYDVDEHDGIPYIAMEYIVGEELNELCRRGIEHDRFLPIEHAVEVMRQAAAGMGYFHNKRGGEGTELHGVPLDIVHCDISPTNLLVTQDGFLKIIDFGIAKSRGQRHRGEGVFPGKLSYMSPEQASRGVIDHRADVFSLGIVLYEITVGKRLFRGPANEVVKRLVSADIPPPTYVRRKFPPPLEAIVMRCLEKNPEDRYQSAYDLADDLEAFLRDQRMHSGPVRVARYLDMLAMAGGAQRRPELVSEAELRREDELDFDTQAFDAFIPAEGAPSPEQAPMWIDPDEPSSAVAAALGIELDELKVGGVTEIRLPGDGGDDGEGQSTNPVPKQAPDELDDGFNDPATEDNRPMSRGSVTRISPPPPEALATPTPAPSVKTPLPSIKSSTAPPLPSVRSASLSSPSIPISPSLRSKPSSSPPPGVAASSSTAPSPAGSSLGSAAPVTAATALSTSSSAFAPPSTASPLTPSPRSSTSSSSAGAGAGAGAAAGVSSNTAATFSAAATSPAMLSSSSSSNEPLPLPESASPPTPLVPSLKRRSTTGSPSIGSSTSASVDPSSASLATTDKSIAGTMSESLVPTPRRRASDVVSGTPVAAPVRSQFGAAYLERSSPPKLPWILVGFLAVALLALVGYMALK